MPDSSQWQPSPGDPGYYWVRFAEDTLWLVYYEGAVHQDGSQNTTPLNICGDDRPYSAEGAVAWLPITQPPA